MNRPTFKAKAVATMVSMLLLSGGALADNPQMTKPAGAKGQGSAQMGVARNNQF